MRPRGARCTDRAPRPAPTIWGRLPRDAELRALGSAERRCGSRAVRGALRAPLTWGGSGRSSVNAAASPGARVSTNGQWCEGHHVLGVRGHHQVPRLLPPPVPATTPMAAQSLRTPSTCHSGISAAPHGPRLPGVSPRGPDRTALLSLKLQLDPEDAFCRVHGGGCSPLLGTERFGTGDGSLAGAGMDARAEGAGGRGARRRGYRIIQGFLSLKGFSEAGTPTSRGSLRACCSQ